MRRKKKKMYKKWVTDFFSWNSHISWKVRDVMLRVWLRPTVPGLTNGICPGYRSRLSPLDLQNTFRSDPQRLKGNMYTHTVNGYPAHIHTHVTVNKNSDSQPWQDKTVAYHTTELLCPWIWRHGLILYGIGSFFRLYIDFLLTFFYQITKRDRLWSIKYRGQVEYMKFLSLTT